MDFLHEMLSKRCSWLSKSWLVFPLAKNSSDGPTNEILDGCLVSMISDDEEKEIKIKIGKINCCSAVICIMPFILTSLQFIISKKTSLFEGKKMKPKPVE